MDPILYNGAIKGDFGVLTTYRDQLEVQMTPNNNSVLHITAQFLNSSNYVKQILTLQPSLLCKLNSKKETPLHIAARKGHFAVVKELIECAKKVLGTAKEMLRMTSDNGDTALHEAMKEVWNDHLSVVKLLAEEDPEFPHPPNKAGETPLYLAVERGLDRIVSQLVETCTSMGYAGPNGRTALHAAAIYNFEGSTRLLLEWNNSLAKKTDIYGWTPLHYAARSGHLSIVKQILAADKSAAYVAAEKDNNNTALHLAARRGQLDVMVELVTCCPDCWEMVDSRGQNVIHIAFGNEKYDTIVSFLENRRLDDLINQKDNDGNTPLHLLAAYYYDPSLLYNDKDKVYQFIKHPKVDKNAFNNANLTPVDVAYGPDITVPSEPIFGMLQKVGASAGGRDFAEWDNNFIDGRKKLRVENRKLQPVDIKKRGDTHLIVSALVATVTFAAGFTVPGGYVGNDGPNKGTAVLIKEAAFKAFVLSDTIAMVLSTCAVFLLFIASFYDQNEMKLIHRHATAGTFLFFAFGAMVIAFMTGLYAVMAPSLGLAIVVWMICCCSLFLFCFLLQRLYLDFSDFTKNKLYSCMSIFRRMARK